MKQNQDKNIELSMNDHFSGAGHLLSKENQPNEFASEINISHKKNYLVRNLTLNISFPKRNFLMIHFQTKR